MSYKHLLFDADNTLFDFDLTAQRAFSQAFVQFGMQEKAHHYEQYHVISQACWRDFEEQKITQTELRRLRFERFFEAAKLEENAEDFNKQYLQNLITNSTLLEGALELIQNLHGNFSLTVITNGLKELQRPRLFHTGLTPYFEVVVVSDEIGVSKPHTPFFDHTFEQLAFPDKSSALVIGDSLSSDIKGGNNYGIDTCWFNPKELPNSSENKPTFEIGTLEEIYGIVAQSSKPKVRGQNRDAR